MGYVDKYLTPREAKIFYNLEKFEVMGSRIVIKLWLKGGNFLDEYLSKVPITWCIFMGILK